MSPTDLHSTLVAKVTEYLNIAEAADLGQNAYGGTDWYSIANLSDTHDKGGAGLLDVDAAFIAAHDPSWAIRSHRQALETLNRHAPDHDGTDSEPWCVTCAFPFADCPEVAGVRAIYLPEASE